MQELAFIKIRLVQSFRELKALGFFYSAILLIGILALFSFYFQTQTTPTNVLFGSGFIVAVISSIHFSRSDHRFLLLVSSNPYSILFLEYFLLATPFVLLSVIRFGDVQPLLPLLIIPLIPLIKVIRQNSTQIIRPGNIIPLQNFEWKAGVRNTGWVFVVMWILAIALAAIPFASLVIIWFLLMIISSFYDQGEPVEMVEAFRLDSSKFLWRKISLHCKSFIVPALPIMILSAACNPDRWWVYLLFLAFSLLNIAVFVVSKYSVWRHSDLNRSNSIVNALCMIGLFLPFLLPLPIIVFVKNFRKALNNLHPVLHDYR